MKQSVKAGICVGVFVLLLACAIGTGVYIAERSEPSVDEKSLRYAVNGAMENKGWIFVGGYNISSLNTTNSLGERWTVHIEGTVVVLDMENQGVLKNREYFSVTEVLEVGYIKGGTLYRWNSGLV